MKCLKSLAFMLAVAIAGCNDGGSSGAGVTGPDQASGGDSTASPPEAVESPTVSADFHTLRTPALAEGEFELLTLSALPDAVSGGDVLIAVRGLQASELPTIAVNRKTAAVALQRDPATGDLVGLVEGLDEGANLITARLDGGRSATLKVINHPLTGPIISGPHQEPFACRTGEAGLGEPLDEDCSVETRFQWFYRSQDQSYRELEDPFAPYPADVQRTTTRDGETVPFVVRVESATINRGIARIAVLDDPAARGPEAAFAPNWNRRVYYIFGESCGVGYDQGVNDVDFVLGPPPDPAEVSSDRLLINFVGGAHRLGKGDAVVHSTLSAFGVHCNPFVSIETTMMVKEHITERYGLIEQFIGTNGSGAALQQYNAANNAPGLITGAMPTASFADIASTAMTVSDCGLLVNYFENSELDWSDPAKQAAVTGHSATTNLNNDLLEVIDSEDRSEDINNAICRSWIGTFFNRLQPDTGCRVPPAPEGESGPQYRYDAQTNPGGARCTVQDGNVNWLGTDPETGFARRPLDNVGVQYGLAAFNNGDISFAEFLDLNASIGGLDIDGNFVPQRHAMDPALSALVYRIGQVIGRGALAETPIMDLAPYLDLIPVANIHESVRPFTIRARLNRYRGGEETQTIWRGLLTQPDAFAEMDAWTDNLRDMAPSGNRMNDVVSARPNELTDMCSFSTSGGRLDLPDTLLLPLGVQAPLLPGSGLPGVSVPLQVNAPEEWNADGSGTGPCATFLPVVQTPRIAAGMPMTDDVIKCRLKPVSQEDYAEALTPEQLGELRKVFPDGVCDYTRPGVGDVDESLLWPSLGGETLLVDSDGSLAPEELRWRAARSRR